MAEEGKLGISAVELEELGRRKYSNGETGVHAVKSGGEHHLHYYLELCFTKLLNLETDRQIFFAVRASSEPRQCASLLILGEKNFWRLNLVRSKAVFCHQFGGGAA